MQDVIVGDFMMDPSRFFIHVNDAMVVLQGRVERRSLIPYLVRAVHAVEGVIQVDDHDPGVAMAAPTTHRWSARTSCLAGRPAPGPRRLPRRW
jgi:hypothetical protein